MYLALFGAKILVSGLWGAKDAKSGHNTILSLDLELFSLPEGLHCLFQPILTPFQVIYIDGREVKSAVVDF